MLPIQGTSLQNTLDGFSHVQPGATQRSIQGHDPILYQPLNHAGCLVPSEIVPDQQRAQWWQIVGQRRWIVQSDAPQFPYCTVRLRIQRNRRRQLGQNLAQFLLQPRMENRVGAAGDAIDVYLSCCRVKQCQNLGYAISNILVGVTVRLALGCPRFPAIGNSSERPCFIFCPDAQAKRLTNAIGKLDQVFFPTVSGSVTSTTPSLRLRDTVPVLHQVRSFCQVQPASCNTHQIV